MKGVSGGLVEPRVRPSLMDSFRPVLQRVGLSMLCTIFGGEISNRFAIGDLERSPPPQTYSCTWLYSNTKVETRDSAGFEYRGV